MIRVAVLLAAFNGVRWVGEQIDSILRQSGVDVTLFISVDRSDDETESLIREFARADHRIKLLQTGLRFGGAGPNFYRLIRDVDFSGFDYVALSDQDDIWFDDKLRRAVDMMSSRGADAYSSNVVAFWDDGKKKLINKAQKQRRWDYVFEAGGPGCTYVTKRTVIEGFRDVLNSHQERASRVALHDWFIYAFVRSFGYKWVIDPEPSMYYRQHSSNQVGVNHGWRAYVRRANLIFSGWWLSQVRLIAGLVGLEDSPFFRPWRRRGRLGMLWLFVNSFQCRRKPADCAIFAVICTVLFVLGDRSED